MKQRNFVRLATVAGLVLSLGLSAVWGASYYASKTVGARGGLIRINDSAALLIPPRALKGYLAERGIRSVNITVELIETFNDEGELDGAIFVFAPTGVFFGPPAKLMLRDDYLIGKDMVLVDAEGELLEYSVSKRGRFIYYNMPHFSSYTYDHYDY